MAHSAYVDGMQYLYAPTRKRFPKAKLAKKLADAYTGFQKVHTSSARGVAILERPLSLRELRRYHLRPIKIPRVTHDLYGVLPNGNREHLVTLDRPFISYLSARLRAKEIGKSREYIDYVASPRTNWR